LTYGKEYQINSHYDSTNGKRYYSILNDKGVGNDYLSDRFVTLEKFREIQLNKIGI
jgi:c-di-AMP phosphodiesterase-like protein